MTKSILTAFVCLTTLAPGQQFKEGETEPYNVAVKDLNAGDFSQALHDLDDWKDRFPATDYGDTRAALYVQTYIGLNQPDKALEAARPMLAKDLKTAFPGPAGQAMIIRLLYNATWAVSHSANPDAGQAAAGEKAARELMAYDEAFPGVSPEKWTEARADMKQKAAEALVYIAMLPGIQAMAKRPPDCAAAESAYAKAVGAYPAKAAISWELGRALNCEAKVPEAIYEFERATVLDPTLGEKARAFADNAYGKFHGSDEGLAQLKEQVKASPLPPDGFTIMTADQIAQMKREAFDREHPELALWRTIRDSLAGDNGAAFFDSQLKDAAVPLLRGTLVDAKPACRPRELRIAVEEGRPEILLKLEKPLAGKPLLNTELAWEGVGAAFQPAPFLLTMDAATDKLQGLKLTPCAPVRSR